MRRRTLSGATAGAVFAAAALWLCVAGPSESGAASRELKGTIRVSGAWALYPMMVQWAEEFHNLHPGVRLDVSAGGAGKGAADALGRLVDIGMVSREVYPEEERQGGFWVSVVRDAVLPIASAANPVAKELARKGVKRETFAALWIEGKPLSWGEVAGVPKVRDQVRVYTRSDACGAAEIWAKYLGKKQEDLKGVAVYGDPGLAEAVRKDRLGIGFNNLNYAYDPDTGRPVGGLVVVPLDINGDGRVSKEESFYRTGDEVRRGIADGRYPSPPARDLNLLTKGKPTGLTREFLLWILKDGQKSVARAGYIALPKAKVAAGIKKIG